MSQVLEEARKKVSFNIKELSYLLWDGQKNFERFVNFQNLCANDEILRTNPNQFGLSREEIYELQCRKAKRALEIAPLQDIKDFATNIIPEALVSSLNFEMFLPTISNLGTPEQNKLFYDPARKWEILGCYAQTELAHGSDVNGFETTATFDKQTQEFVINTPNLGATKWWGSDMGLTSTHAVTQAVLIVDGKRHGIQNFVIPIRDVKTHLPLPGIKVGDIGGKMGFNSKDNGFLTFDNVRIPLVNMLSKYTQVNSDGSVTKSGDDKIWHATMQLQRQHFLDSSWKALGQALTITVRYSIQRTQFKDKTGRPIPIFNYQSQQARIIPAIAEMYGNMFGSKRILKKAKENVKRVKENGDFSMMLELHVLISAAKAFYTWNTYFTLEKLRQCCGGHGYSFYSGMPSLLNEFATCVAAEGDNTVLSLSVGKAIMALLNKSIKTGKAPNDTVDYLENFFEYVGDIKTLVNNKEDLYNPIVLKDILRYNVACNVGTAGQRLQELMGQGLTFKEATDKHMGIILNEISRTQSNYWTLRTFIEDLESIKHNQPQIYHVLQKVQILYGILKIIETQEQIYEYGILTSNHFKWVKQIRDELFLSLKDEALGLSEATGYDNHSLRSAIARDDGQMYETLLKWAEENPVNDPQFQEQLFQKVKPLRGLVQGPKF